MFLGHLIVWEQLQHLCWIDIKGLETCAFHCYHCASASLCKSVEVANAVNTWYVPVFDGTTRKCGMFAVIVAALRLFLLPLAARSCLPDLIHLVIHNHLYRYRSLVDNDG